MMNKIRLAICSLVALLTCNGWAEEVSIHRQANGNFASTREALVLAIENRGLVINYVSHLAEMLKRTGHDLGKDTPLYDEAEIIEFCSARLSRQMMEADPRNIVMCPFAIAVYTLPGDARAWLAYRRPQGSAAAIVTPLLQDIVGESLE